MQQQRNNVTVRVIRSPVEVPYAAPGGVGPSNQKASKVSQTPTTSCSAPAAVHTMSPAVTS